MRAQQCMRRSMDVNAAGEDEDRRLETVRALGLPGRAHGSPLLEALCATLARQLELTHCLLGVVGRTGVDVVAAFGVDIKTLDTRDPRASFFLWPMATARADMMVIQDVSHDSRFADKHWVRTAGTKFYVSVPLLASNGAVIGYLVGINASAKVRPAEDYHMLCNFAELAIRELESAGIGELQDLAAQERTALLRQPEESTQPVLLCEVTSRWWNIEFASNSACEVNSTMSTPGIPFWGVFNPAEGAKNQAQKEAAASIARGADFVLQVKLRERQGSHEPITIRFRSARSSLLGNPATTVQVPHTIDMVDTADNVKHTHYFGLFESAEAPSFEEADGEEFTLMHPQLSKGWGSAPGLSDIKLGLPTYSSNLIRVYRSFWHRKVVAVKVMAVKPEQCVRAADGYTLVPREAELMARLVHPNLIATYKVVVQPARADCTTELYRKGERVIVAKYVREWYAHGDLQILMDGGAFMEADNETPKAKLITALAHDIAAGFQYLHSQNVVGANVHPKSILLVADPAARAHDLKPYIAKLSVLADAVVTEGPVQRSIPPPDSILLRYAAPELLSKGIASKAGDVYAFGKLLWQVLTNGQRECRGSSRRSIDFGGGGRRSIDFGSAGRRSVDYGSRRFAEADPSAAALEALLQSCLAHKPQARPTFDAIVDTLESLRSGLPEEAAHRGHPSGGLLSSMSMMRGPRQAAPRASMDQGRPGMNSLVIKTLGSKTMSRKGTKDAEGMHSVGSPDAAKPPMLARKTMASRMSSSSQDYSPTEGSIPESASERGGLVSKLSGRLSFASTTSEPQAEQPSKPKDRLTSRLFGKKLKQVLQHPTRLGVS